MGARSPRWRSHRPISVAALVDEALQRCRIAHGLQTRPNPRATIAHLLEAVAEEHLVQPTVIYELPAAVSRSPKKNKPGRAEWV